MLETLLALSLAQAPGAGAGVGTGLGAETGSGQFLLNGQPITQVVTRLIDYFGDCPGQGLEKITNVSFLASVSPGPYRRILISNQMTGGYTDREYDERRPSSEGFAMASGQGQHGSFLTLARGMNMFSYVVRDRVQNQVLDQGFARLRVSQDRVTRQRNFSSINTDQYCASNRSRDLNNCANGLITLERTGVCPDASRRVLSLETIRLKP